MAINHTPAWSIEASSHLRCPVCSSSGVSGPIVDGMAGELDLAFRCDQGHTWTLRLATEHGRTVATLCDLQRRDGETPYIPWSQTQTGIMRRLSDWDMGILITDPENDDD